MAVAQLVGDTFRTWSDSRFRKCSHATLRQLDQGRHLEEVWRVLSRQRRMHRPMASMRASFAPRQRCTSNKLIRLPPTGTCSSRNLALLHTTKPNRPVQLTSQQAPSVLSHATVGFALAI